MDIDYFIVSIYENMLALRNYTWSIEEYSIPNFALNPSEKKYICSNIYIETGTKVILPSWKLVNLGEGYISGSSFWYSCIFFEIKQNFLIKGNCLLLGLDYTSRMGTGNLTVYLNICVNSFT